MSFSEINSYFLKKVIRADRTRNNNGSNPGLYYISLNPNSSFRGPGSSSSTHSATTASFINVGYQTSRANRMLDTDEPPNYYEAILVGSHASNNRNTISSSLNKNQNSRHDLGHEAATTVAAVAAATAVRAAVEVERSNATGADADEITTSTTMTRTQAEDDEIRVEDDVDANDGDIVSERQQQRANDVEYLDISMDDEGASSVTVTDAAFFIEHNSSQRGRSTDV